MSHGWNVCWNAMNIPPGVLFIPKNTSNLTFAEFGSNCFHAFCIFMRRLARWTISKSVWYEIMKCLGLAYSDGAANFSRGDHSIWFGMYISNCHLYTLWLAIFGTWTTGEKEPETNVHALWIGCCHFCCPIGNNKNSREFSICWQGILKPFLEVCVCVCVDTMEYSQNLLYKLIRHNFFLRLYVRARVVYKQPQLMRNPLQFCIISKWIIDTHTHTQNNCNDKINVTCGFCRISRFKSDLLCHFFPFSLFLSLGATITLGGLYFFVAHLWWCVFFACIAPNLSNFRWFSTYLTWTMLLYYFVHLATLTHVFQCIIMQE